MVEASPKPFIEVRNLRQQFGSQEILRGVNLTVFKGETLVLLGRSGGGKSVFLRHLIGLIKPVSGEIFVDGEEITHLNERQLEPIRIKVGMLFQDGALFDSMDVYDNVAFPLREHGQTDEKKIQDDVMHALELVNMLGHETKMPVNLSGGMRKRVALARAIINHPACILYDEPTAGLDPIVSDSINRLIRRLQRQLHMTSIVVTHDMTSTYHIADRVALLHEGKERFYGTLDDLKNSTDTVVQDFVLGRSYDKAE
ncbi:MAG: ABC transporter ATP-binding protein [Chthoniobacterales bacterium]